MYTCPGTSCTSTFDHLQRVFIKEIDDTSTFQHFSVRGEVHKTDECRNNMYEMDTSLSQHRTICSIVTMTYFSVNTGTVDTIKVLIIAPKITH